MFGARPVDMTAHPSCSWPVSSDPCLTIAAVRIGLTLQETLHIFLRLHPRPGLHEPYMSNVIMAPGALRDSLRPDQSFW